MSNNSQHIPETRGQDPSACKKLSKEAILAGLQLIIDGKTTKIPFTDENGVLEYEGEQYPPRAVFQAAAQALGTTIDTSRSSRANSSMCKTLRELGFTIVQRTKRNKQAAHKKSTLLACSTPDASVKTPMTINADQNTGTPNRPTPEPSGGIIETTAIKAPPTREIDTPNCASVVPIEEHQAEAFNVSPSDGSREGSRKEGGLVHRFCRWLSERGVIAERLKCRAGDTYLLNDIFIRDRNHIIEAKGDSTRESARMAIGQLLDYRRFAKDARMAVLLPERPESDVEDLLRTANIACIWPNGEPDFIDNHEGLFIRGGTHLIPTMEEAGEARSIDDDIPF